VAIILGWLRHLIKLSQVAFSKKELNYLFDKGYKVSSDGF